MLGEGRLVGSTGWGGFGSGRRREETVRAERSQRQLRLAWLGHSGAFPPLKDLSLCPDFCSRALFSLALDASYFLLEKR